MFKVKNKEVLEQDLSPGLSPNPSLFSVPAAWLHAPQRVCLMEEPCSETFLGRLPTPLCSGSPRVVN